MNTIRIHKLLIVCFLFACLSACNKEDAPKAKWEYAGPVPEITNGPSEAQKMCYALWQKYDLHVYYNLSGEDALRTEVGYTQENSIISNNGAAIPMQAAEEAVAEKFLSLLTQFFSLLPDDMVRGDLHKRHVLVKINPGYNKYKDEDGNIIFSNTHTEDQQGIIHYGYLNNEEDTDDKFVTNLVGWKRGICHEFFRGLAYTYYKNITLPERFGLVSKGLYYYENESGVDVCMSGTTYFTEIGKKCGFINPFGAKAYSDSPYDDWASYVAWILTVPLTDRQADLDAWPKIREKYELVLKYYQNLYELDMEKLAEKWQAVQIN